MLRSNKTSKETASRMTKEKFEAQLLQSLEADPNASIDEVVRRVKSGEDSSGPTTNGERELTTSGGGLLGQIPKPLFYGLLIFILVFAVAAAAIFWKPWENTGEETPTPAVTAGIANAPDAIRFHPEIATTVAPGETVSLPLSVLAGGQPAAGVVLSFTVSPPDGGAITPTATTDTGGATTVDFTAGNTQQPVTINVQTEGNPEVNAQHTLTIAPQPALTASFKNDPPVPNPIRAGENFIVWFQVDNTGQVDAGNVILKVNTPPGLAVIEVDSGCTNQGDNTVSCEFGPTGISAGSNGSKFITYRADDPVTAAFTPDTYSVSFNGASANVRGSEEWTANIESPRAAGVSLSPSLLELGADGASTADLSVEVKDQWGDPFTGAATVELSLAREVLGDVAAPPTPIDLPLSVACNTLGPTTLTLPGEEQTQELSAATSLRATAYNPNAARLFVTATLDNTETRGWVEWPADAAQRTVSCLNGDVATLPAEPPQETAAALPDGQILPSASQTISQGTGTFTYQAGTVPGTIRVVANLPEGESNSVGEPGEVSITLLEVANLVGGSHLYDNNANAAVAGDSGILLFRVSANTPLALLQPVEGTPPGASPGLVAIWVPTTYVSTETTPATLALSTQSRIHIGTGPQDQLNTAPESDQMLLPTATGQEVVQILETRDDLTRILLRVWVNNNAIAQPAQE